MPQPKIDEQARAAMHEGGGVTASGEEKVGRLYTNLQDPSGLADLLLDERVDIRLVRGTCLKALDRRSSGEADFHPSPGVRTPSEVPRCFRHARGVTEVEDRRSLSQQGSDYRRVSCVGNQGAP